MICRVGSRGGDAVSREGQVKAATERPILYAGEDVRAGDVLTLSPADGLLHRCRARDVPFAVAASATVAGQPVAWLEERTLLGLTTRQT
jgi:hypothetical protein